jgi:regulator of sigma E protease
MWADVEEPMNDILLWIISFAVVLTPLILIHEFGHFIAARLVGVTVLEFGIGFPPRALKLFEQGGTEFTLNWIPLGGFVRPLGEDFVKPISEASTEKEREAFEKQQAEIAKLGKKHIKTKSVAEAGPWQRMFFISAGAAMNFLGAFVILVIAAMLGRPAPAVVVLASAPNSPAKAANIMTEDILLSINGQEVKTADEAKAILEGSVDKPVTLTLKRGNSDQTQQITLNPTTTRIQAQGVFILDIAKDSPAAQAGLESGDIVVRLDKRNVTTVEGLKSYVDEHAGQTIALTYERKGEQKTVEITPRKNPPEGQGALGVTIVQMNYDPTFGVALADSTGGKIEKATLGEAISYGARTTLDTMGRVISAPILIIRGQISREEARPVSPVGIAQYASVFLVQSANAGQAFPILNFAAVISVALGITQLLPIPGLDGGRILFVIVEILRGKPMNPEREGMVHLIGLMLMLALVAILVVNDILHPINIPGLGR